MSSTKEKYGQREKQNQLNTKQLRDGPLILVFFNCAWRHNTLKELSHGTEKVEENKLMQHVRIEYLYF